MSEAEPSKMVPKDFWYYSVTNFLFPYRTLSDVAIWEVE